MVLTSHPNTADNGTHNINTGSIKCHWGFNIFLSRTNLRKPVRFNGVPAGLVREVLRGTNKSLKSQKQPLKQQPKT